MNESAACDFPAPKAVLSPSFKAKCNDEFQTHFKLHMARQLMPFRTAQAGCRLPV